MIARGAPISIALRVVRFDADKYAWLYLLTLFLDLISRCCEG